MTAWARVLLRRREPILDALLWAGLSTPIAYALLSPPYGSNVLARMVGALLLMAAAVAASRRAPLVSLVLVVLPTMVDGNFVFAIPVMSYLVGRRMSRAGPAALAFSAIALVGTVVSLGPLGTKALGTNAEIWYLNATTLLFAGVFPWLVGRYRRQHRILVVAGRKQAELLNREQRGAADRVRMRERARIAQDMHDSLGHDLSLIALQAAALEMSADLDERHRRAAGELRVSVAEATDRLRQVIGVLRDDAEPAPVLPAGEDIAELVERARGAGMSVRLLRAGSDDAVPRMVDQAAHRVVQEALTNATRHAPGAAVTVRLTASAERTVVRVRNDPPPAGPLPGPRTVGSRQPGPQRRAGGRDPAGSGLVGLRERVRLAGGTLRAGPSGEGFEVVAELPHSAVADHGTDFDPDHDAFDPDHDAAAPEGGQVGASGSASAHQLRKARQRVRRSLVLAVTVPVAIGVALTLVYYPIATFDTVLESTQFDRMRLGQQRAELRDVLPGRQIIAPEQAADRPAPAGAACEFYTDGNFPTGRAAYRLCFLEGRLTIKERVSG